MYVSQCTVENLGFSENWSRNKFERRALPSRVAVKPHLNPRSRCCFQSTRQHHQQQAAGSSSNSSRRRSSDMEKKKQSTHQHQQTTNESFENGNETSLRHRSSSSRSSNTRHQAAAAGQREGRGRTKGVAIWWRRMTRGQSRGEPNCQQKTNHRRLETCERGNGHGPGQRKRDRTKERERERESATIMQLGPPKERCELEPKWNVPSWGRVSRIPSIQVQVLAPSLGAQLNSQAGTFPARTSGRPSVNAKNETVTKC